MAIVSVLLDPILPVFAIMAVGFFMGKIGRVSVGDARTLNKFALSVLLPIFGFGVISHAPLREFNPVPVLVYLGCQVVLFSIGFTIAERVLKRSRDEAILLAFAGIFANNALYTLPISILLYGPSNVLPVTTITTMDSTISMAAVMVALQLHHTGKVTAAKIGSAIFRTPLLQAVMAGLVVSFLAIPIPASLDTFIEFSGAGAAPVALFAMGAVLSQTNFAWDPAVPVVAALKLVAFPVAVWTALWVIAPETTGFQQFVLAASGPAGVMSFSFALLYGTRTDAIAQIIVWTSVLSLISMAFLA